MDLKSVDPQQITIDEIKKYKSFQFVKLCKSDAEINREKSAKKKKLTKLNKNSQQVELDTSKPSLSSNKNTGKKRNETLDLSNIESVEHVSTNASSINLTSTPNNKSKHLDNGVKSIMKNKSNDLDSLLNMSSSSIPSTKPKKRNKSVSFMLEDAEEVVVKKSKSNNPSRELNNQNKQQNIKEKVENSRKQKQKKNREAKEILNIKEKTKLNNKENVMVETMVNNDNKQSTFDVPITDEQPCGVKKKVKKTKKIKSECKIHEELPEVSVSEEQCPENKSKKLKKKKRKMRSTNDKNADAEGEPAIKTRKKDLKPELIAKGLENLNIGDNAHTLTNLLDEMTVVDKNAKKKNRQNLKKNKQAKPLLTADENSERKLQENSIGEKEKIKWHYRRWNKDVKRNNNTQMHTSIVVENIPLKIICDYKSLLSKHFSKFGTIAGIGVVETYPTEQLKPVFTTTIFFQKEEAVAKALEEDNTLLEGIRIRVRRPLPPTETTVVVRAHGLTDQALSSIFSSAGRVRSIRLPIRKKIMTGFVEFDGPEAVERAMKIGEVAKINGKKVYVSKFEIRKKINLEHKRSSENNSVNEGDSDSSTE